MAKGDSNKVKVIQIHQYASGSSVDIIQHNGKGMIILGNPSSQQKPDNKMNFKNCNFVIGEHNSTGTQNMDANSLNNNSVTELLEKIKLLESELLSIKNN